MVQKRLDFQYGAVYFRKSNPPKEDWDRDYKQAAHDHMNIFRHWFMWGAIETAPGQYDWQDYDTQLELAARHGIRTVIAEQISSVPEWLVRMHPDWLEKPDGASSSPVSVISPSCATGGFGVGLCLDNPDAREAAGNFLRKLAARYSSHPAMYAYDIWNECNHSPRICRCEHTQQAFRNWLKNKYGSLSSVNQTWHRYSYASWEDIVLPAGHGIYPESVDLLEFMKDRAYEHMEWRIASIRRGDDTHLITAHGLAGSVDGVAIGCDDWLAASKVETYGFTWCPCRKGNEPWKQMHAVDVTRAGSRGKPFWHAEMQGGPLWLQPQLPGRPIEDGRIPTEEDIRVWNLKSIMGGASGILYPRWRPLLDGPLFGAFGIYANDGSPTKRSQMGANIAAWAQDPKQDALFAARPVKGDIGIVLLPECQRFNHFLEQGGKGQFYAQCVWGAYKAFLDNNIQADFVHMDDIGQYERLYLPYPLQMDNDHAQALKDWVKEGGFLISEGCLGYFSQKLTVQTVQPGLGFDTVCGARESDVAFIPDLTDSIVFDWHGERVAGGLFKQTYTLNGASELAQYGDGGTAVVQNRYSLGTAVLIGTYPSAGYLCTSDAQGKRFFADMFALGGAAQHVVCTGGGVVHARLWQDGRGRRFLWVLNHAHTVQKVEIAVAEDFTKVPALLWGENMPVRDGDIWRLTVPAMDALVFEIA